MVVDILKINKFFLACVILGGVLILTCCALPTLYLFTIGTFPRSKCGNHRMTK